MAATDAVVDASAMLKLVVDEAESDAFTRWFADHQKAGGRLLAPHLLRYEFGQRLMKDVQEHGWTAEKRENVHDHALRAVVYADGERITRWAPPSTYYDAAYIALAKATEAVLVTYDKRMAKHAHKSGIETLTP